VFALVFETSLPKRSEGKGLPPVDITSLALDDWQQVVLSSHFAGADIRGSQIIGGPFELGLYLKDSKLRGVESCPQLPFVPSVYRILSCSRKGKVETTECSSRQNSNTH
jgi:hypothetical protein